MVDLRPDAGLTGDRYEFLDCGQHVGPLVAQVGRVHAVILGRHLGQGDQFIRVGETSGRVDQRRRDTDGAFLHRLANEVAHLFQFVGRRLAVLLPDHVPARRGGTDERRNVGRNSALFEKLEIFGQRRPFHVIADIGLPLDYFPFHCVVERPHRAAFAHDLERNALADVALGPAVMNQRFVGPGHHVDEAGRHGQATDVDLQGRSRIADVA